jgi:hypothetical protein
MARPALGPLLAAAVVGAAVGAASSTWIARQAHPSQENLHDIVHQRFELTAAEHRRLDAAEARYATRRAEIEGRIRSANAALAASIRANPQLSPGTLQASQSVEAAAAELQSVTLQHIFEMRAALDPAHRTRYDAVLVEALTRDR